MLWLILGDYGSGKTLRLLIEAFSEEYLDRKILVNFTLNHPNSIKLKNPLDLKDLENVLVLLDEMQNWFNSHNTMSLTNDFFTDFIHDCDKMNVDVFGTSHRWMSNEKDFRMSCHRVIKCERIGRKPRLTKRVYDSRDFRFQTFSMYDGRIIEKKKLRYDLAKAYFPKFDTRERIKRPDNKTRELLLALIYDPDKAVKIILNELEILIPIFKNGLDFSHPNVAFELAKIGYGNNEKIRKLFYSQIKQKI